MAGRLQSVYGDQKQPGRNCLERVGGTTEDKTGAALEEKRVELKEQMDFICFQQYEFAKQWEKLKQYDQ